MVDDMRVYIANLGKYNEGELVGDWFSFPIDEEDVAERIGLNSTYEEYAVHDTDNFPIEIGEYISIEELNEITEFAVILLGDLPPLSFIEGAFLKYFGIPVALTWFMSQKTFDGKKPYSFLKSQITFALRPKVTYAGKAVKLEKGVFSEPVTAVRSVMYVPD